METTSLLPSPSPSAAVTITPSILYFGTPVVLLTTLNEDGTANLAPVSSAWALGHTVVLGLGPDGQTGRNLLAGRSGLVLNLPGPGLWPQVELLGGLTGRPHTPDDPRGHVTYEPDKFAAAGLTPVPSEVVSLPRVAECPLQLEARAAAVRHDGAGEFLIVEAGVLRVHAAADIVVPGTQYVDPAAWTPLVYNFRHYFGLGPELGHSARSQTPRVPAAPR
ncbi:flavin reductase family protein [Streptomyces sp. NPDC094448]|uniref:flavin reductase family protein n=1 Tax=Streptomyces sp. NPDC094448 TaxID=3366063 RepID=UPI00382FF491